MSLTPEESKEQISQLVANYKHSADDERQRLSEADVRADYIDRLFLALGWNVYNDPNQETAYHRQGYIRGAGMVDVGMEIASKPVLMQEAKRFGIIGESRKRTSDRTLEEKQVFRYARGRGIPHAILSNFERTLVFNADHERLILYFDSPDEYLSRVEDLLLLSPEKIKAGSLQWLERQGGIKDIDEAFLASMREWRLKLANAIYQHNAGNPELQTNGSFDFHKLMMAVQRILDRLMLIRYADDKEVLLVFDILDSVLADYRKRGPYAKPDHLMQQFIDLSHMMDQHHNTKLFQPGHICEKVNIPNDVLAAVMEEMNNISFRKFTSDILGATYESYLATRLALKNGEIVSQEQKEARKKRGIYYTPSWVVHYIVDNTLGRLLNELEAQHGIKAIEKAAELRVLDPACGSGSFLIYAYQVFANFYRKMNKTIEEERVKLITPVAGPDMFQRLEILKSIPEPVIDYPQYILSKHLYGVDIDPEAAEIAAVNLTMTAFADSRKEKLPLILDENIKVGNSLVSGAEEELRKYFGDTWRDKRPFNWEDEFPAVMQGGGFDVVVGNPPYVRIQTLDRDEAEYYRNNYEAAFGSFDIYVLFLQKGIGLLKHEGGLGFICSSKFLKSQYGSKIIEIISRECTVEAILDLSAGTVFAEATTYPAIVILKKGTTEQSLKYIPVPAEIVDSPSTSSAIIEALPTIITNQDAMSARIWPPVATGDILWEKITQNTDPLGKLAERIFQGLITSADKVYILEKRGETEGGLVPAYSRATGQVHELEAQLLKPLLSGKDIKRYGSPLPTNLLLFPYEVSGDKAELIPANVFANNYTKCWEYLSRCRMTLEDRENGKMRSDKWYAYIYPKNLALHDHRKLAIPRLVKHLEVVYDNDGSFYLDNVDVGGVILKDDTEDSYLYMVGLLHSQLLDFCFRRVSALFRGDFRSANRQFIEPLPIRRLNLPIESKKRVSDEFIQLVRSMLLLHIELQQTSLEYMEKRHEIERKISQVDEAIDALVYDLYGLTEEERQIVERETGK